MKENNMENALKKAIEVGWNNKSQNAHDWVVNGDYYQALLDPLFWQALFQKGIIQMGNKYGFRIPEWKHQMHSFIDHIASGGDYEVFFEQLLGNKK